MKYIDFEEGRKFDLILLGRIAIDFNPAYTDLVKEEFKPLKNVHYFEMFVGGSPANIACGVRKHGMSAGFFAKVSDDQMGDYVTDYFRSKGIDVSRITRAKGGEKTGLSFTEMLSPSESSILMYRNQAADLALDPADIDEEYIRDAKAILISGTSLAQSPSREAALKAIMLAKRAGTKIIFDIDYRGYSWKSKDEISIYYSMAAREADIIMGSREEYDLTEAITAPGRTDEETAAYWMSRGNKIIIIKHGKEGSTAHTADGSFNIKPFPIDKLKSFGGGDGYGSSFIFGLLEGWDIIDCLELGSASASLLVNAHGCSLFMPTLEELRAYIKDCKDKYGEMVARG